MASLEFKITKKQIYEIFDKCYPNLKESTDKVGIETKKLKDGREAIQLTIICKTKNDEFEEIDIQDGDTFTATF